MYFILLINQYYSSCQISENDIFKTIKSIVHNILYWLIFDNGTMFYAQDVYSIAMYS